MEKILFIGPIANSGGPAIKNRILVKYLERQTSISVWNTYDKSLKARLGAIFKILFAKQNYIIVAVSRKGRNLLYPFLLLKRLVTPLHFSCIVIGGRVVDSFNNKLSIKALYKADVVTVETKNQKEQMEQAFKLTNVYVMSNYKELTDVKIQVPKSKYEKEKLRFVFLSSMRNLKGIRTLIEAFCNVKDLGYKISLDFFGPIKEDFDQELLEKIRKTEGMDYCGEVKNENVLSVIQEYDVFVFPTECKHEGFPAVLVEAQAAGLPVIASNVSDNPEIIKNGENGYIFAAGDVKQLENVLIRCYTHRSELYAIAKRNQINAKQYNAKNVITAYANQLSMMGWPI